MSVKYSLDVDEDLRLLLQQVDSDLIVEQLESVAAREQKERKRRELAWQHRIGRSVR
jgi:hypothetical protein